MLRTAVCVPVCSSVTQSCFTKQWIFGPGRQLPKELSVRKTQRLKNTCAHTVHAVCTFPREEVVDRTHVQHSRYKEKIAM